jgi:polysaccharide biosynthesis/export protein
MKYIVTFLVVAVLVGCARRNGQTTQPQASVPTEPSVEPFPTFEPSAELSSRRITITVYSTNKLVFIAGQVHHPGRITWTPGLTLTNAIALAGGFTDFADTRRLEIRRIGGTVEQYSYQQAVSAGTNTPQLKCGDAVNVKMRSWW